MKKQHAKLLFKEKLTFKNGLLRDAVIWDVSISEKYPDGVRYRLALVDTTTGEILVLFDNHYPKGHHLHTRTCEEPYHFKSVSQLVDDYMMLVKREEKRYEDQKNST